MSVYFFYYLNFRSDFFLYSKWAYKKLDSERFEPQNCWGVLVTLSTRLLSNWLNINKKLPYKLPHDFLHSKWAFAKSLVSLGFEPQIFAWGADTLSTTMLLRNWVNVIIFFNYLNFPNDFLYIEWAHKKFGFWEIRTPKSLGSSSHLIQ